MLRLGAALGHTRGTLSQSEHLERAGGILELAVLALADIPRMWTAPSSQDVFAAL